MVQAKGVGVDMDIFVAPLLIDSGGRSPVSLRGGWLSVSLSWMEKVAKVVCAKTCLHQLHN